MYENFKCDIDTYPYRYFIYILQDLLHAINIYQ